MLVTDMAAINPSPVSQALDLITSGNNRHCYPHSQMMRLNLKEVKLWLKVIVNRNQMCSFYVSEEKADSGEWFSCRT